MRSSDAAEASPKSPEEPKSHEEKVAAGREEEMQATGSDHAGDCEGAKVLGMLADHRDLRGDAVDYFLDCRIHRLYGEETEEKQHGDTDLRGRRANEEEQDERDHAECEFLTKGGLFQQAEKSAPGITSCCDEMSYPPFLGHDRLRQFVLNPLSALDAIRADA